MGNENQVFFLHFAGGSSSSYNFLSSYMSHLEIHQLELPGRGSRSKEPFVNNIEMAVKDYTHQILDRLNQKPFVIFGHSMGAAVGIRVVQKLEELCLFANRLIVSGYAGPGIKTTEKKKRYLMNQEDFLTELRKLGGLPERFYQHRKIINYLSPIIRSDIKIIEEAVDEKVLSINAPITALMGDEESDVCRIQNWEKFTESDFGYQIFKGKHFFIHKYGQELAQIIHESY